MKTSTELALKPAYAGIGEKDHEYDLSQVYKALLDRTEGA